MCLSADWRIQLGKLDIECRDNYGDKRLVVIVVYLAIFRCLIPSSCRQNAFEDFTFHQLAH